MSSAFLPSPTPPSPSKEFILEDCCNTIKSWVAKADLWKTDQQELGYSSSFLKEDL